MIVLQENPHLAELVRNRLETHYQADEIIKGVYWEDGKGCAVGCMTESHEPYNVPLWDDLGVGLFLPRLCDVIFEGLPNDVAKEWPLRFWSAIESAKGKDLGLIHWKFLHWILDAQLKEFHHHEIVGKVITDVCKGIMALSNGEQWLAAQAAVDAAADAATNAATNAAYAATNAANAATNAAHAAAYAAAYKRQADKLIELIEA